MEALRLGAFDYLYKPAAPEAIRQRVREGIQHRQQSLQRSRLLEQIENLRQNLIELDKETETIGQTVSPHRFIRTGKLVIDKYHRSATLDGELLDLNHSRVRSPGLPCRSSAVSCFSQKNGHGCP